MDEDKNKQAQPLFAEPYKDDDQLTPEGPRFSDLLEEPPIPPEPVPQYQRPASSVKKDDATAPIRTFQSDIAQEIKGKQTSVVQIALAEAKKREREDAFAKEESAGSRKNIILISLSAILFFAALGVIGYLLWPSAPQQSASLPAADRPIIIADSTKQLPIDNLDRSGLVAALQKEVSGDRDSLGSVSMIVPTKSGAAGPEAVDATTFMQLFAEGIPDGLARSLGTNFVFGIHVFQKNEPYLILKTDSYQSAFAGMLEWETRMPYDLADVFIPAASRSTTLNSTIQFRDEIVSNHDVRALVDSASLQTVLLYSFVDKNTLVITTNERTLQEISDRISKAMLVK